MSTREPLNVWFGSSFVTPPPPPPHRGDGGRKGGEAVRHWKGCSDTSTDLSPSPLWAGDRGGGVFATAPDRAPHPRYQGKRSSGLKSLIGVGLAVALASTAVAQTRSAVKGPDLGQPVSAEDIAKWEIDIPPSGKGLPAGSGTVAAGEAVYARSCQSCHGPKGAGKPNDALVGGVGKLAGKGPARKTVGSY